MAEGDFPASRRDFIKGTGAVLGGAWLGLHAGQVMAAAEAARQRQAESAPLEHLQTDEARLLGAVADQIYPPDDTPGARDLGAVYFMDFAAGGFMAGAWPMIREGVQDLDRRAKEVHGAAFAELDFATQTSLLEEVDATPFFGMVHFLTLLGCFCLPEYGGNRDGEGWAQLGFESRHVWQPPFGHYDAQAGEGDDGSA